MTEIPTWLWVVLCLTGGFTVWVLMAFAVAVLIGRAAKSRDTQIPTDFRDDPK